MTPIAVAGEMRPGKTGESHRRKALIVLYAGLLSVFIAIALPAAAAAEQASEPTSAVAGQLDAGGQHTCAVLAGGQVRCWGWGSSGQLGYGNQNSIGNDETPGSAGPVDLGPGRRATAVSAGAFHTCALLDDATVRCWGFGGSSVGRPAGDGRLGYGNPETIGDNESPGSVGPVQLGRPATAITAGGAHSCALLDNGSVLCWGFGEDGRLGYGDPATIGDDEVPGSLAPIDLGGPAKAISAGASHTCALLVSGSVRCWGNNGTLPNGPDGRLGVGNTRSIGDDETPGSVPPVEIGAVATAISAGDFHTCAVLDGGGVRCWGSGTDGRLGYGDEQNVGDNEAPSSKEPVALGGPATAISAGNHTCARLVSGNLHCWGPGSSGQLGYGNTEDIGDTETPGSVGPVNVGRPATAISVGSRPLCETTATCASHSCAKLDDGSLRCWGLGFTGRLGYGNENNIGDDETPASAGPIDVRTRASVNDMTVTEGDSGERTVTFTVTLSSASGEPTSLTYATTDESATAPADYTAQSGSLALAPGETSKTITLVVKGDTLDEPNERFLINLSNASNLTIADQQGVGTIIDDDAALAVSPPPAGSSPSAVDAEALALQAQRARLRGLRTCLADAGRHASREVRRARSLPRSRRAALLGHARRHKGQLRRACLGRWGRTPGRVTGLTGRGISASRIALTFMAAGTHGDRSPSARTYLIKQSRRPIRSAREFRRAESLCSGRCRFPAGAPVGGALTIVVTDLRPRTTYYYAVAARDNVSGRQGPRSSIARARTR